MWDSSLNTNINKSPSIIRQAISKLNKYLKAPSLRCYGARRYMPTIATPPFAPQMSVTNMLIWFATGQIFIKFNVRDDFLVTAKQLVTNKTLHQSCKRELVGNQG